MSPPWIADDRPCAGAAADGGRRPRAPGGRRSAPWRSALVLSGCQVPSFGAFKGSTTQGQDAFKLWQGFFIAGAVIFVLVFVLIIWAVLRYRRRSDAIPAQFQYHTSSRSSTR